MKKIFAVAILALATLSINAQDFKTFRIGPAAGLNIAKVSDSDAAIGFSVGARAEYNFNDNIYLGSGLLLSQKGFKAGDTFYAGYLEMPINAGYRYCVNDKFAVFGEVGPYLGVGIYGKDSYFDAAKRFDFGLGFGAGVEYAKFQFRFGYELGLTKVFPDPLGGKNKNFFFGVAYMF
jgi:hypothetical protein